MGAGPSEGHQGTAYHPALRHAQDVSEVSQSPLSDRTQQVKYWRYSPGNPSVWNTALQLLMMVIE